MVEDSFNNAIMTRGRDDEALWSSGSVPFLRFCLEMNYTDLRLRHIVRHAFECPLKVRLIVFSKTIVWTTMSGLLHPTPFQQFNQSAYFCEGYGQMEHSRAMDLKVKSPHSWVVFGNTDNQTLAPLGLDVRKSTADS